MRGSSKLLPPPSWNEFSVYSKELPAGATLEHYKILKVLGNGGFGITYLVRDTMLKRKVVLKENFPSSYAYRDPFTGRVIPNNEHDAESFQWTLSNFLNEARVLAQLDSPGIVRVLSVFECNGTAYFSMDYVQGLPLDYLGEQQLLVGNCYSESKLRGLLVNILQILDYLHKKGICHRDIKPGNILLTQEGAPVLIDFGASRHMESNHTQTVLATHGFSSPEQALGRKDMGPWSDLYSLGATFYSLLKGVAPPRGEERLLNDTIQPLAASASLSANYSKIFLRTIDKALSPRVEDRYNSAEAWMKDLRIEGGAVSTIKFSPEEFKSARKRFFNLFALSSSRVMSEGQEKWGTGWKRIFGGFIVVGILGAALGYFVYDSGEKGIDDDALGLRFPSVMSTPIPQIISDSRDVSLLSSMEYFDVRLDSPSLSRHALPSVLPDRFSLACVHLRVLQEDKMCPPLYLTIRDEQGNLISRSFNGFSFTLIESPVLTGFRFVDLPALKVDVPYRFSFETKDNVPHPLKVVSSQITTLESGKVLKPHFKFICAAYEPGIKASLDSPENSKLREMLIASRKRNRTEIDSIVLTEREKVQLRKFAKAGYPSAQYKTARLIFERDGRYGEEGGAWLYKAAMGGFIVAQRDLAFLLVGGKEFFPDILQCPVSLSQNYSQAVDLLLMSFTAQDPSALYMLGILYSQGWGVDYSAEMVARLSKLLGGSGYDLSRLTLSAPILAHWELLGQKEEAYTRMCCSIPDKKMNEFSGVRLVRTSKEGGSLFIDKVILFRDGQEVMSRSFRTALTWESPVLEVPMNMEDYAENVENFEWSIEVIMAPANTCGIMEMMKKKELPNDKEKRI
ncbi:protein kinase [Akkermansia sp.]|uniref:protein kinase domain-containing protein n=1 Tax=Akkermansia sp. TaxID=1872421 RepID=UPI0025C159DB|nr:protein kinase [Akkermansia sp.]MCD8272092.1 protein kinase [Akkermansia sp.]